MNKNNNFLQQTHFIGVLLPDDITSTLEDCRRYMNQNYGCRSGHGTPIHVTLVPPFTLPEEFSTSDLIFEIEKEILPLSQKLKFISHIDNFDDFADRTIFAKIVHDEKWKILRDKVLSSVLRVAPNCTKKDKRPFIPHLTVATRDIPIGVSTKALEVLNELNFTKDFSVDNITIFERKNNKWITSWIGEF